MNVREQLLHNEIQNLGQMVQIVSYELTLLSDFIKEKFGSSYETFRQKHSQQNILPHPSNTFVEPENVSPKKINLTARKSTGPLKRSHCSEQGSHSLSEQKRLKTEGVDYNDDEDESWEWESDGGLSMFKNSANDSVLDDDPLLISGDEDEDDLTMPPVADPNNIPEGAKRMAFPKRKNPTKKGIGRGRSDIWNKFIVSRLPNGKLHAKCPRCKAAVSSKVERLTSHYRKCCLGEGLSKSKMEPYKTESEICIEEADKMKVKEYIKALKEGQGNGAANDDTQTKATTSTHTENETTSEVNPGSGVFIEVSDNARSVGGRKLDPVWDYFKIMENPETKKRIVKCKRCGVQVSSKVERVRRHFVICQELDKEGEGVETESHNSETASVHIDIS